MRGASSAFLYFQDDYLYAVLLDLCSATVTFAILHFILFCTIPSDISSILYDRDHE